MTNCTAGSNKDCYDANISCGLCHFEPHTDSCSRVLINFIPTVKSKVGHQLQVRNYLGNMMERLVATVPDIF